MDISFSILLLMGLLGGNLRITYVGNFADHLKWYNDGQAVIQ